MHRKNIVDGMSGAMIWIEIQEGKIGMSTKEHQRLGSTADCMIRGVQVSEKLTRFPTVHDEGQEVIKRLYFGNSWFKSVKATTEVAQAGHHNCFILKTGHSRSSKAWLEEKMMDYPGGTLITLEATPLEKKWVTHYAYSRLYTKMVGMTVTDTWKILKKQYLSHSLITKFADILAHEMLDHAWILQDDIQETAVKIRPDESSVTASTITADIFNRNLTHIIFF